jgi:hypothetical protein
MGPIEEELRQCVAERRTTPRYGAAWRVFESAHKNLALLHVGDPVGWWNGCCGEAMSEAIEAAEALGL